MDCIAQRHTQRLGKRTDGGCPLGGQTWVRGGRALRDAAQTPPAASAPRSLPQPPCYRRRICDLIADSHRTKPSTGQTMRKASRRICDLIADSHRTLTEHSGGSSLGGHTGLSVGRAPAPRPTLRPPPTARRSLPKPLPLGQLRPPSNLRGLGVAPFTLLPSPLPRLKQASIHRLLHQRSPLCGLTTALRRKGRVAGHGSKSGGAPWVWIPILTHGPAPPETGRNGTRPVAANGCARKLLCALSLGMIVSVLFSPLPEAETNQCA
jgi:hypothetical protein